MQAAAAVAQAYDMDDLDDEWHALLNELEDRLLQVVLQYIAQGLRVAASCLLHNASSCPSCRRPKLQRLGSSPIKPLVVWRYIILLSEIAEQRGCSAHGAAVPC